jgi:N-acetylmuramoyl-L-alanine amidase
VKDRRFPGFLALTLLVLPVLLAAQIQRPDAPTGREPAAVLDGRELPLPVTITPAGPAFGLSALVNNLGGTLAPGATGESSSLTLEGKEVVIGVGSAIITVGDSIVSLSQPVTHGEGGTLVVPLDFLRKTYGDVLGYSFDWRPETQRLIISRRAARELPVTLDVVHLQGMTTVVLQFSEAPRYQIKRRPGMVDVQMMGDRLAPPPRQQVQDPFVQDVTITPEQVHLQVAPGLDVASYVLENPFRIVFDVHQPSAVETPAPTAPGVTAGTAPGIHTIVIDPGHGGTETGAIGPSGAAEKELTLLLARELETRLSSRLGVRVVLTRSEDATLPLDTRAAIANQNKADLFISVHLNSSLGSGARGAETYFLSAEASDAKAAKAAAAENAPAAVAPPPGDTKEEVKDLELILWDLAQTRHLAESQRFAALIQAELNDALQLKDRGVKQAPFRVLNGAEMPAVLVELGFISNPEEEKKLQDATYRGELVDALTRAVQRYKEQVESRPAATPATALPGGSPAPAQQPMGAVPHSPAATPPQAKPAPTPPTPRPKPSQGNRP